MWHINRHIDISLDKARFIYVLIKGHSVDLPSLIIYIIHDISQENNTYLPFGCLIT